MNTATIELAINFGLPLALLIGTYFLGGYIERRHFRRIAKREKALTGLATTTFEAIPQNWTAGEAALVSGSVVVSLDYFKRFIAGLRIIVGGRVKSYEPLLDRARREAVLRMKEEARDRGFDAVINVRLQTSRLANSWGNGQGTAGVEVLAFGTGLVLDR